ncbi:MAG: acyl-CoA dehydratase activase [Candidatus Jordarchaeales archaeon]
MGYVIGLDMGSTTTKALLLADKEMIYEIRPTGVNPHETGKMLLSLLCSRAGISLDDVACIVATGYGRVNAPYASIKISEIACHAKGAYFINRNVRIVIDVGGQDSKVIAVGSEGEVVDFYMNDKCAAGTGRFLDIMASTLEMSHEEMAHAALSSRNPAKISSMCTVFAESEVISLIAKGARKEDIAAGLCHAIADRLASMVRKLGVKGVIMMSGGVAKNTGLVNILGKKLGEKIYVPDEPQIIGALGAALIAKEKNRRY